MHKREPLDLFCAEEEFVRIYKLQISLDKRVSRGYKLLIFVLNVNHISENFKQEVLGDQILF